MQWIERNWSELYWALSALRTFLVNGCINPKLNYDFSKFTCLRTQKKRTVDQGLNHNVSIASNYWEKDSLHSNQSNQLHNLRWRHDKCSTNTRRASKWYIFWSFVMVLDATFTMCFSKSRYKSIMFCHNTHCWDKLARHNPVQYSQAIEFRLVWFGCKPIFVCMLFTIWNPLKSVYFYLINVYIFYNARKLVCVWSGAVKRASQRAAQGEQ